MKLKSQKNLITISIFLLLLINVNCVLAEEPTISALNAVLIDADTGALMYSKNHLEPRPPASTTKILTAILAIEKGKLHDVVNISKRAAQTGEASLNLFAGEKITLENLLYGALLKSGNDACVAIAEHISPSVEEFVGLMNLKAQTLGCTNSNFVNTNGLPAKDHYSSAMDLAIISRYALKNPVFSKMVATSAFTVNWEESTRKRTLQSTNRLLTSYSGATGVKTGTTIAAGQCLVASANRENRNLIAVVLKSPNRYGEATKLLDYGFNYFRNIDIVQAGKISVIKDGEREIEIKTGRDLKITVPINEVLVITHEIELNEEVLKKYIAPEQVIGLITYYNNNKKIGQIPLLATKEINKLQLLKQNKIWQFLKGKIYLRRISWISG